MEISRGGGSIVIPADGFKNNEKLMRGFDWRGFDAYLFDIDGTLLNSRDAVHYEAFLTAMQAMYGRRISLDGLVLHGSTDPLILLAALEQAGVGESDGRAALVEATERMCTEVETRAAELRPELCGSVRRLLDELKRDGKLMGLTSGNVERIGWAKLKAAGIDEYFSFGSKAGQRFSGGARKRRGGGWAKRHGCALWAIRRQMCSRRRHAASR
jgi:hypothetical protein